MLVFNPGGRQGIGVNQPQSDPQANLDYPLVLPSENVRYLLADAYLAYDDTGHNFVRPFKIAWLYGLGTVAAAPPEWSPTPTHAADLLITDANGDTVFDSTVTSADPNGYYDARAWDTNYYLYEWRTSTAVCRLVVYTSWSPDETPTPRTYPVNLVPESAILDERVSYCMPGRVRAVTVLGSRLTRSGLALAGGYNVTLTNLGTSSTPGGRIVTQIQFDAISGSGQGVSPGCEEPDQVVRTLNQVGPTAAGDFLLGGNNCAYVRQPVIIAATSPLTTSPTAATLQLGDNCQPCCTCDDYMVSALYLNQLQAEYLKAQATLSASLQLHTQNVARWNAQKACRDVKALRLVLQPQNCPDLDIALQFCNQTTACQTNVNLIVQLQTLPEIGLVAPAIVCGRTSITGGDRAGTDRYTMQGTWPQFTAHWDAVNPFESVFAKFRLKFPGGGQAAGGSGDRTPYVVTATLQGTIGGQSIMVPAGNPTTLAQVVQTVTLGCGSGAGGC